MSTNWISVIKIAGTIVDEYEKLILAFESKDTAETVQHRPNNTNQNSATKTPTFHHLLEKMEKHATCPPVVFFHKFIDPWTVMPVQGFSSVIKKLDGIQQQIIETDLISLLYLTSNNWRKFHQGLNELFNSGVFQQSHGTEARHLLRVVRSCTTSWAKLLQRHEIKQAILIYAQPAGISWSDEDVKNEAQGLPTWFAEDAI